jgi:peptidoglycan/xylan/chitin deacetylase (PgdA/CDA1 family)
MSRVTSVLASIRNAVGALLILAIVLIVPLFSVREIGSFVKAETGRDSRSAEPLAALNVRPVDATAQPPRLFQEPLISITFDDGHETTYSKVMPLLQKYGIRTTQYLLSGTAKDPHYVSWDQIGQMQQAGHEIACHSKTHSDLTTLNEEYLTAELKHCKEELGKRYGTVRNFASPYGAQNDRTLSAISKYFGSQRNTEGDPTNGVSAYDVNIASNFKQRDIIGVTVRSDTTIEQLEALVAYTRANNGWLVLTYHQADDSSSKFAVDTDDFGCHFNYLSGTDVRIVTVQEALETFKLPGAEY